MLQLVWLILGVLVGLLAAAAYQRTRLGQWLFLVGTGVLLAIVTGWLGVWLLGSFFATAVALWIAIAGVVLCAWKMAN
jgi:uncharacterized membrane protein YeaQ/YmgE (transglycosylase-associated protein family)